MTDSAEVGHLCAFYKPMTMEVIATPEFGDVDGRLNTFSNIVYISLQID